MAFSKEFEAVMENEEFSKKLEGIQTKEELISAFEAEGIDIEKEIDADFADNELSDEELESVAGGFSLSMKDLGKVFKVAWKGGADVGVILRAYYDTQKYGNATRTYTKERIFKAARNLGLE